MPCYFGTSPVRMLASHFLSYRFTFLYNKIATKPYFLVLCHSIIIIHLDHIIIIHFGHFIIIIHLCRVSINFKSPHHVTIHSHVIVDSGIFSAIQIMRKTMCKTPESQRRHEIHVHGLTVPH